MLKEAANGQEGVTICQEWYPDLIWMDIRMPIMDGYEATRQIKAKKLEKTPVIIAITASVLEEEEERVLEMGCDDFVRKPFTENEIFDTLKKQLGITYIYAEKEPQSVPQKIHQLAVSDLTVMSEEWLAQLKEAAIILDDKEMLILIREIPEEYHQLAESLQDLVEKFRVDIIVDLLENCS